MSSGAGVASRSARSSSASSAAAMPSKRRRASRVLSLSRIGVFIVEIEEVAGHMLQDQPLQTLQIEQAEAQRLFDGGEEGNGGIGALQFEQAAQATHTPPVGTLLQGRSIALEARMIAAQELLLERRAPVCPHRRGMMPGHGVARVALA